MKDREREIDPIPLTCPFIDKILKLTNSKIY